MACVEKNLQVCLVLSKQFLGFLCSLAWTSKTVNFILFFISEILMLQEIPLGILILRLAVYLETDL